MLITGLIIGAVLGLVLQRGRFCITGAFRDLWVSHSSRWFTAFLLAITIQALGVSLLTFLGVIAPEAPKLSVIATVLGSFLFGVGIVLAGGCATGTYYRAGEGLVGSWSPTPCSQPQRRPASCPPRPPGSKACGLPG